MNFSKNIFLLIVNPSNGWAEIKRFNVPSQLMLSKVFYPLLAIVALTAFIPFFYGHSEGLSYFIQISIISFVKYFFGYLVASYLLGVIFPKISADKEKGNKLHIFLIYNYCILVILGILGNILPVALTFLDIFPLYIIFVVWKGMEYLDIDENPAKFVVITSAVILLSPFCIKNVLLLLLPSI